jgi:hypothetical protein
MLIASLDLWQTLGPFAGSRAMPSYQLAGSGNTEDVMAFRYALELGEGHLG